MGQEPNIQLRIEDLPRPTEHPDPPRRWQPTRPGELGSPDEVPWGGAFGTPGPDTGYVLALIARADLPLGDGEDRHDAEVALGAIAGARASHFGRAPTTADIEIARIVLGLAPDGIPDEVVAGIAERRGGWWTGIGHDPARARALVAAIPLDVLTSTPDEVRARAAAGEQLVGL